MDLLSPGVVAFCFHRKTSSGFICCGGDLEVHYRNGGIVLYNFSCGAYAELRQRALQAGFVPVAGIASTLFQRQNCAA